MCVCVCVCVRACVRVCVCVERCAAVLAGDVRRCLADSRAALHLCLLRGSVQRPTRNMGQADVPHVGLWSEVERRWWMFVNVTGIAQWVSVVEWDRQTNKQVRQLSGLAYIPKCRSPSPQIVYNTGRHRASSGLFVTRSATVVQVCRTGITTVERVIDFSIFDLGGLPLGQNSPKGEITYYPLDLPSCKISARLRKRSTRYALPKFFPFWRWFLTLKVIQDQIWRCQSKARGSYD